MLLAILARSSICHVGTVSLQIFGVQQGFIRFVEVAITIALASSASTTSDGISTHPASFAALAMRKIYVLGLTFGWRKAWKRVEGPPTRKPVNIVILNTR